MYTKNDMSCQKRSLQMQKDLRLKGRKLLNQILQRSLVLSPYALMYHAPCIHQNGWRRMYAFYVPYQIAVALAFVGTINMEQQGPIAYASARCRTSYTHCVTDNSVYSHSTCKLFTDQPTSGLFRYWPCRIKMPLNNLLVVCSNMRLHCIDKLFELISGGDYDLSQILRHCHSVNFEIICVRTTQMRR